MDRITDNIYIGSSQDALHRVDNLRAQGITAVLNVARDLLNANLNPQEFKLYHVGLMDGGGNHGALLNATVFVLTGLLDTGEKVLVHCHEGKSRSAAVVATYLTRVAPFRDIDSDERMVARLSIDETEEELRKLRPRINIQPELKADFKKWLNV